MLASQLFAGTYAGIRAICYFVEEGARLADFDDNEIFQVKLACDEACANIIKHAYGGENRGTIRVSWQIEPTALRITLYDTGEPFVPTVIETPDLPADSQPLSLNDIRIGGWGLQIIRQVMDEVTFNFGDDGNSLTLRKNRPNL